MVKCRGIFGVYLIAKWYPCWSRYFFYARLILSSSQFDDRKSSAFFQHLRMRIFQRKHGNFHMMWSCSMPTLKKWTLRTIQKILRNQFTNYALYAGSGTCSCFLSMNSPGSYCRQPYICFYTATYIPVNPQLCQPDQKWGHYQPRRWCKRYSQPKTKI